MGDIVLYAIMLTFLAVGLGLVVGGVVMLFKRWRAHGHSLTTTGRVILMTGGTTKAPVVQFTTSEGEAISFTHGVASRPPRYRVGQEVMVRYQPGRPHEAWIDSFSSSWLTPLIMLGVGIGMVIIVFLGLSERVKV
jgi:hypothetical protein